MIPVEKEPVLSGSIVLIIGVNLLCGPSRKQSNVAEDWKALD